jgi:hypothetical protein
VIDSGVTGAENGVRRHDQPEFLQFRADFPEGGGVWMRGFCGLFCDLVLLECGFGVVSGLSGIFTSLGEDWVKVADISCEP